MINNNLAIYTTFLIKISLLFVILKYHKKKKEKNDKGDSKNCQ